MSCCGILQAERHRRTADLAPWGVFAGTRRPGLDDLPVGQLNTYDAVAGAAGVRNTALIGGLVAVGAILLILIIAAIASGPESGESGSPEPSESNPLG